MPETTDGPENLPVDPPEPSDGADQAEDATRRPERTSSGDPDRTEAAWQEIVAELSDLSTNLETELTTTPETPRGTAPEPAGPTFDFPVAPWVDDPQGTSLSGRSWRRSAAAEALDEAEGEFVPPDPGFELSRDPLRNLGWFVVATTPVLAILSLFWPDAPAWTLSVLSTAFLGGAGLLVWRLPKHRDDSEGRGGGAVV